MYSIGKGPSVLGPLIMEEEGPALPPFPPSPLPRHANMVFTIDIMCERCLMLFLDRLLQIEQILANHFGLNAKAHVICDSDQESDPETTVNLI